jgi:adenine-specific DNA methylase
MNSVPRYSKRLIEVDLPIREISAHARREKSIRHGHISTLHLWWARRPLAACRAVLCAALWPDPADPNCPELFRNEAEQAMRTWRDRRGGRARRWEEPEEVRAALLAFIADFANWDNSTNKDFLEIARRLTQVAHEALGGAPGTRPLVVDPFAGGGAIPLEALRVGADTFASDLNPVAVLLNKVVLEYIPTHGARLAEEVRRWGAWVEQKSEEELGCFYPQDRDGAVPIAYLWARTIRCEGPGCGAEVPLLRSLWLSKKKGRSVGMRLVPRTDNGGVEVEIQESPRPAETNEGTVRRGFATCPCCGFTTPVASVRMQLKARRGGSVDARLMCVVTTRPGQRGRFYRLPTASDLDAIQAAAGELARREAEHHGPMSLVPDEPTTGYETFVNRGSIYGMARWADYFTPRQALALTTLVRLVRKASERCRAENGAGLAEAVATVLGLGISRFADICNALCMWESSKTQVRHLFTRQAIPMLWDFAEPMIHGDAAGDFSVTLSTMIKVCEANVPTAISSGHAQLASATSHPLPDDAANAFVTDPPYYFSVQYADLSDFFYVWLRRTLFDVHPGLFDDVLSPKDDEIIVQTPAHQNAPDGKNSAFYESRMKSALEHGRRVLAPNGVGTVVFAHTSTAGWEALLQALVDAGWIVTASWPIDTEMASRVIAQGRSVLASSVHLVCRPREDPDGSLREDAVGDWRAVLRELPERIHSWMPRLAAEGVVGADAIFACLGPSLEIFSRYSQVEKASGEVVTLREYLEHVWAAVAREALSMIFDDPDTAGLEEDARLSAMWLWTLSTGANGSGGGDVEDQVELSGKTKVASFTLEFDAARKIAQGLGAHLEDLGRVVEVKGDKARLLSVSERTRHLFGKDEASGMPKRRPQQKQFTLFQELDAAEEEAGWGDLGLPPAGETALDRVHQAMILFAAGRGEALKRFLVEEGTGRDARFWKLAQALSALYPSGTEEKRWVDGVLARKKGLGF